MHIYIADKQVFFFLRGILLKAPNVRKILMYRTNKYGGFDFKQLDIDIKSNPSNKITLEM